MTENNLITTEEWRPVVGYEGIYAVSSLGRVKRTIAGKGTYDGRILAQQDTRGYRIVSLTWQAKAYHARVHKLVALAFIGPIPDKCEINHKDGVKHNNRADNLEYVTHQENVLHASRELGRAMKHEWSDEERERASQKRRGSGNARAKLTEEIVAQIRREYANTPHYFGFRSFLCKKYNVPPSTISNIVYGHTWKHVVI